MTPYAQYNTKHIITGHPMYPRASVPQCVQYDTMHASRSISNILLPYNKTHIITGHLMYHRASMAQCVQYGTTHRIT